MAAPEVRRCRRMAADWTGRSRGRPMKVTERVRGMARVWAAAVLVAAWAAGAPLRRLRAGRADAHGPRLTRQSMAGTLVLTSICQPACRRRRWSSGCMAGRGDRVRRRSRRWRSSRAARPWRASISGSPGRRGSRPTSTTSRRRSVSCARRRRSTVTDSDRIAIAGSSSGGHLAVLVGVSNGQKELEGTVGGFLNQSSACRGDSRLLRRLESDDDPRAVDASRVERAPSRARTAARRSSRRGAAAWRGWRARDARRPQRSAPPYLSRRSGSADADQPVARAAGRVREGGPRRLLRRRAWRRARRGRVLLAGSGGARAGVSPPHHRTG